MGAQYLVTDLELRARFDLAILDAALKKAGLYSGGVTYYHGAWRVGYSCDRACRSPQDAVDNLVQIVENLGDADRALWDRCTSRRFDIGYMGSDERFSSRWQIKAPFLRRLADVNGDIVITIYRPDYDTDDEQPEQVDTASGKAEPLAE